VLYGPSRRGIPLDQCAHAVCERFVIEDMEQATTAVLATITLWARQRTLLIHVAEDHVIVPTGLTTQIWADHPRPWSICRVAGASHRGINSELAVTLDYRHAA
jgi:hypothetical protein